MGEGLGEFRAPEPPAGFCDRIEYLILSTPVSLMMTVASVALGTAISTAHDMTTGITARLRTKDIALVSEPTGHAPGAVIRTGFAAVIVTASTFLLGFRSDTGALECLV